MSRTRTLVDLCLALLVVFGLRELIEWTLAPPLTMFPVANACPTPRPTLSNADADAERDANPTLARTSADAREGESPSDDALAEEPERDDDRVLDELEDHDATDHNRDDDAVNETDDDDATTVETTDDDTDADTDDDTDDKIVDETVGETAVDPATEATAPAPRPRATQRRRRASSTQRALGRAVYKKRCAACHGANGKSQTTVGKRLHVPPINRTPGARLARAIRRGVPGTKMRAYSERLSARELQAVTSFARAL